MSNKDFDKLLDADKLIRSMPFDQSLMGKTTLLRISFVRGFELFNTRPYHNYETNGDGYIAEVLDSQGHPLARSEREDLDESLQDIKVFLQERIGK